MVAFIQEIDNELHQLNNYDPGSDSWYDTVELIKMYLDVLNHAAVKAKEYVMDCKIRDIYSLLNSNKLDTVVKGVQELEKQIVKWSSRF